MPRNMDDSDNYITRRLSEQRMQAQPVQAMPVNTTQPVGGRESLGAPPSPTGGTFTATRPAGSRPLGDIENDFMNDPRHAGLSDAQKRGAWGGLMSLGMSGPDLGGISGADIPGPDGTGGITGRAPGGVSQVGGNDLAWRKTLSYGGGVGNLSGFNTAGTGYDDKAANSVKNTFGRLAQRYPATPEGLKQLMNDPDFKRAFPNASLVPGGAGDKIDFGGVLSDFESGVPVGIVDVGQAFDPSNNSGQAWWWGHEPDGGGGPNSQGGAVGGIGGTGLDLASILSGKDPLTDIIKRIQDLQSGRTPDAESQALINMLTGGLEGNGYA